MTAPICATGRLSQPAFDNEAIDGINTGRGTNTGEGIGTAAHRRQTATVSDIATDPPHRGRQAETGHSAAQL